MKDHRPKCPTVRPIPAHMVAGQRLTPDDISHRVSYCLLRLLQARQAKQSEPTTAAS